MTTKFQHKFSIRSILGLFLKQAISSSRRFFSLHKYCSTNMMDNINENFTVGLHFLVNNLRHSLFYYSQENSKHYTYESEFSDSVSLSSLRCAFHFLYLSIRSIRYEFFFAFLMNWNFSSSFAVGLCNLNSITIIVNTTILRADEPLDESWSSSPPDIWNTRQAAHTLQTFKGTRLLKNNNSVVKETLQKGDYWERERT